ncbi:MAG: D-glycerate dehydrogenase [Zetaproteobacteria bacterium]|nr:MAG: D-glycerate dehydrogenase [Zetaproteobacteria bacterium]
MNPVVLVTRKLPQTVEDRLRRDFRPRLNADDRRYGADGLIEAAAGADAILTCHTERFAADVIARLPRSVRIVATFSVGFDHIDVEAAKRRGLVVTNTPEVVSDATAEVAVLLMLGAARRAGEGDRLVRTGAWRDWSPDFMVGTQVTGKRLGIVGLGRIGRLVARRARAFDMAIHYHDVRRLPPDLEEGATFHPTVEDLLSQSDVLTFHCAATPETRRMLNAERIALLPEGAIVVNASRGAVIDDDALIAALASGKVAAVGLDVYNNEPDIHPGYRELSNTFLMPHIGTATRETRAAMGFRVLDNLDAYFAGREPRDRVA